MPMTTARLWTNRVGRFPTPAGSVRFWRQCCAESLDCPSLFLIVCETWQGRTRLEARYNDYAQVQVGCQTLKKYRPAPACTGAIARIVCSAGWRRGTPAHTAAVCVCRPKLRRRPTPRRPAACPRRGRRHSSTPQRTEIMGKPRLVVRADRPDKAVMHQLHPGAAPRATPCAAVRYRRLAPIYDFVNSSSRLPFAALPGPPRSLQQPPMRLLCSFLASVPRGQ